MPPRKGDWGDTAVRLINYGSGEIADRLTILALKILFGTDAGKDTKHFRDEQTVLHKQLTARNLSGDAVKALLELAAVNAALWHAEDELRAHRGAAVEVDVRLVVTLAFRIQNLNDTRAGLVGQINKLGGGSDAPEKL